MPACRQHADLMTASQRTFRKKRQTTYVNHASFVAIKFNSCQGEESTSVP